MRLNYSVPEDLAERLDAYCKSSCRSASSVVRQLLLEYLEGDRQLPPRVSERGNGHRTSMSLKRRIVSALEERVEEEGHFSKGAVIAHLLRQLLARAPEKSEEEVPVLVKLPAGLHRTLEEYAARNDTSVETLVKSAVRDLHDRIWEGR